MTDLQRPIVSVVVERTGAQGLEVLVQRRCKRRDPYDGVLEFPQGGIEQNESMFEAAARELLEESGLRLRSLVDCDGEDLQKNHNVQGFLPLACVHDVENGFLGVALVGKAEGATRTTPEAKDHQWIKVEDLAGLLAGERIFPLNVPMIHAYLEWCRRGRAPDST